MVVVVPVGTKIVELVFSGSHVVIVVAVTLGGGCIGERGCGQTSATTARPVGEPPAALTSAIKLYVPEGRFGTDLGRGHMPGFAQNQGPPTVFGLASASLRLTESAALNALTFRCPPFGQLFGTVKVI